MGTTSPPMTDDAVPVGSELDFVGIGFGPSNLALAVVARESGLQKTGLFLERNASFQWHPGMMLDGARMQISFLKDLATLRDPASPFTFLQYTKARGRLERFVNLGELHPSRLEYQDYLRWVAEAFAGQVRYRTAVKKVTPVRRDGQSRPSLFRMEVEDASTRERGVLHARNVVCAAGGTPRVPAGCPRLTSRILHSSGFLPAFPARFPDQAGEITFVVVGDGQSAGEVVAYMQSHFPRARIHLLVSGYAPRATDNSPFINEQFYSTSADRFFHDSHDKRRAVLRELRNANYGVIEGSFLDQIYRTTYLDEVKGQRRLFIHPHVRLLAAEDRGADVEVTVQDRFSEETEVLRCDGLVLATGYDRRLDPVIFEDLLPLAEQDESGELVLSRDYRVQTKAEMDCGLYVQGYGQSSFGLGDTLLSLLPFRSKEIFDSICESAPRELRAHAEESAAAPAPVASPVKRLTQVEYPPRRHVEDDVEKSYTAIERFMFATLVSAPAADEPVVTQVPMTLDRRRGPRGTLFGHMDRSNPHVELLDGRRVLALFHGPNAYISPHVYETDQLPTWNSITVQVRGRARVLTDSEALIRGLCGLCEQADARRDAYRLDPADPRIARLIHYIVGFELEIEEIVGRFKLSQDRNESDRRLAAGELSRRSEAGERAFIERMLFGPALHDEPRR